MKTFVLAQRTPTQGLYDRDLLHRHHQVAKTAPSKATSEVVLKHRAAILEEVLDTVPVLEAVLDEAPALEAVLDTASPPT